jgi:hypothetical protein
MMQEKHLFVIRKSSDQDLLAWIDRSPGHDDTGFLEININNDATIRDY